MLPEKSHDYWMKMAIKEAIYAAQQDEVPVGALVVCNGTIIGKGYNQVEKLTDVTAHAEMLAITAACNYLGAKFLEECTLYVTLEPCLMCASALKWARIGNLVYGASDLKAGFSLYGQNILHPKTSVVAGVLKEECGNIVTDFFKSKRD